MTIANRTQDRPLARACCKYFDRGYSRVGGNRGVVTRMHSAGNLLIGLGRVAFALPPRAA